MFKKQHFIISLINFTALLALLPLPASAKCQFESKTFEHLSHYKLEEEKCRYIASKQDTNIEIKVEYPEMKIIETKKATQKLAVTFNFRIIQPQEDGVDRTILGIPLLNAGPITTFSAGRTRVSTFLGQDGREVFVNEYGEINRVHRNFSMDVQGTYQYAAAHKDIRDMDDFALEVFKNLMSSKQILNKNSR